MGGFFGVAAKESCTFDLFLAPIIIHIWVRDVPEWRYMVKMDFQNPSTISRELRSVPSLSMSLAHSKARWESDVFRTLRLSRS